MRECNIREEKDRVVVKRALGTRGVGCLEGPQHPSPWPEAFDLCTWRRCVSRACWLPQAFGPNWFFVDDIEFTVTMVTVREIPSSNLSFEQLLHTFVLLRSFYYMVCVCVYIRVII